MVHAFLQGNFQTLEYFGKQPPVRDCENELNPFGFGFEISATFGPGSVRNPARVQSLVRCGEDRTIGVAETIG